jgi:hypothetical protein
MDNIETAFWFLLASNVGGLFVVLHLQSQVRRLIEYSDDLRQRLSGGA